MLPAISRPMLVRQFDQNVAVAADLSQLGVLQVTHYVQWNDQCSDGEVTIEGCSDLAFTGTWSPLLKQDGTPAVISFSGANREDRITTVGGAEVAVRHRISKTVQGPGGLVTTRLAAAV